VRPTSPEEVAALLAQASREGRPVTPVGGGTRWRRGRPADPGERLPTEGLARLVEHAPADLTVTVEAGMAVADLAEHLAQAGQHWAQPDVRPGSTVGGVLAAGASGRSRLRFGPVRDSLLQVVLVTGDGRVVTAGGRTVKGVAGYDIPRLAVGSLGTLGVIVQATLKLLPLPPARAWFTAGGDLEARAAAARRVLAEVHRPAAVLLTPGRLSVELVGIEEDVVAPDGLAPGAAPPEPGGRGLVDAGVPPREVVTLATALERHGLDYEAQAGVGACRVAVDTSEDVERVRAEATALGGHAVVVDGPDDLRADPWGPPPPGTELMRRLKAAFDPAGVLAPGRLVAA
jgi:glycolate oxidase FAD binding subunit